MAFRETLPLDGEANGALWLHQGNQYDHPRHSHDAVELNVVVSGRGMYEVEGETHPLAAGTALWLRPGEAHYVEERTPDFRMWILAVDPSVVERALPADGRAQILGGTPNPGWNRVLPVAEFHWLVDELERIHERSSTAFLRAGLAYSLVAAWEAGRHSGGLEPGQTLSAPLLRAMQHLDTFPSLSREELAESVNVAPERLGRLFLMELGVSFTDYRNRLRRFLRLVKGGKHSLLAASLEAGFGSYAQFHRVFHAEFGTSPGSYCRQGGRQ